MRLVTAHDFTLAIEELAGRGVRVKRVENPAPYEVVFVLRATRWRRVRGWLSEGDFAPHSWRETLTRKLERWLSPQYPLGTKVGWKWE